MGGERDKNLRLRWARVIDMQPNNGEDRTKRFCDVTSIRVHSVKDGQSFCVFAKAHLRAKRKRRSTFSGEGGPYNAQPYRKRIPQQ